mgnify:CR=1 FL=1
MNLEKEKKKLFEMSVNSAISSWIDKKNGIYINKNYEVFSIEYCEQQIKYFKKLKLWKILLIFILLLFAQLLFGYVKNYL